MLCLHVCYKRRRQHCVSLLVLEGRSILAKFWERITKLGFSGCQLDAQKTEFNGQDQGSLRRVKEIKKGWRLKLFPTVFGSCTVYMKNDENEKCVLI